MKRIAFTGSMEMYPNVRLYPGEMLQGALGRLQRSYGLGFPQFNTRMMKVGSRSAAIRSALDFRGAIIWNRLWPDYQMKELLREHTLAPMFIWRRTFRTQAPRILTAGSGVSWAVRIPRGTESCFYKFCPQCWKEELERYGERHWDTLCQVPGVDLCLRHDAALQETSIRLDGHNVPYELGYVLPEHAVDSHELKIGTHSRLIAETVRELLLKAPPVSLTVGQWLYYLSWLAGSEQDTMAGQYRVLGSSRMQRLVRSVWGVNYGNDIGWDYPLGNLKDYHWWGWLKLLKIISPKKRLVNALRECARLVSSESE